MKNQETRIISKHLNLVNKGNISTGNGLPDELIINEEHFSDTHQISTKLNEYFSSITQILNSSNTDQFDLDLTKLTEFVNNKVPDNTFFNIPYITSEQVSSIINALDPSKTTGLDGIGPKIIKIAVERLSPSLTGLINESIRSGKFPHQMKFAKVFPIHKKTDPSNNRSISILPTISKIIEKHGNQHPMKYSEIPLLRSPKIKTSYLLKTLFAKFKLFFSSFSTPSVPLIRDHLWDCPKWSLRPLLDSPKGGLNIGILLYLNKYKIIYENQSGFHQKHSCQTSLDKLIDQWMTCIDRGDIIGSIFVDFRKGFDVVDHSVLLSKLPCHEFSANSISWFVSYLINRKQATDSGLELSDFAHVKSGVPQGAIFGPTLLFLFIDDLPSL